MNTYTRTTTITITEARRPAAKIAADLMQLHVFYDAPSVSLIERIAEEAAMLLRDGYFGKLQCGFKRAGVVVFVLEYVAHGGGRIDEAPGQVPGDHNLAGASWFSFLEFSPAWWRLTASQRDAYEATLPIQRSKGDPPTLASGVYYGNAKSYSTENVGVSRTIIRTRL